MQSGPCDRGEFPCTFLATTSTICNSILRFWHWENPLPFRNRQYYFGKLIAIAGQVCLFIERLGRKTTLLMPNLNCMQNSRIGHGLSHYVRVTDSVVSWQTSSSGITVFECTDCNGRSSSAALLERRWIEQCNIDILQNIHLDTHKLELLQIVSTVWIQNRT